MKFIPINKPVLDEREKKAVLEVLESGILTDASYEGGKHVQGVREEAGIPPRGQARRGGQLGDGRPPDLAHGLQRQGRATR